MRGATVENRLLAVGYNAGRSGAPRALLDMLTHLKSTYGWSIRVALAEDGPLLSEFRAFDRRARVVHLHRARTGAGWYSVLRALGAEPWAERASRRRIARAQIDPGDVDIVLVNSAPALAVLGLRLPPEMPLVVLVHELDFTWRQLMTGPEQDRVLSEPDVLVAGSAAVATYLKERGAAEDRVVLIAGSVDNALGSPPSAPPWHRPGRVLSVGSLEWRKGADLFIQAALLTERDHPGATEWVWIGDGAPAYVDQFRRDVRQAGLDEVVRLVEPVEDLRGWYSSCDVLSLCSREDPFPLVVMEAALAAKPVVCFANAGGAPELVGRGAGAVVPGLDVRQFAHEVWRRVADPELSEREGEIGRQLVRDEHSVKRAAYELDVLLRNVQARRSRGLGS